MSLTRNLNYWQTRPQAPTIGTVLGHIEDIDNHCAKEYHFGQGRSMFSMFVIRKDPDIFAYLNLCPHMSLPLNARKDDFLNPDSRYIRCTMHFANFRIEDGFCVSGAAKNCWLDPIPVYSHQRQMIIGTPISLTVDESLATSHLPFTTEEEEHHG